MNPDGTSQTDLSATNDGDYSASWVSEFLGGEGIADGSFRPLDPSIFAALLFGALNWVPRWHKDAGKLSIQQVVDSFMDLLTKGIEVSRR